MLIFNIVIIMLIMQMLLNIFSKTQKKDVFSCGLFGWTGENPSSFDMDKLKILGVLNEERGTNSCGLYINEKLHKGDSIGTNNEALFRNLFINESIQKYKKKVGNVIIGHTRNASRGGIKSVNNTHPFMFDIGDGFNFIGAHNGTLDNHKFLAEKYEVNLKDDKHREKVDSEILLEIISKANVKKPDYIKVLQDYKGAAALVLHSQKEKETVFVFRGKSKKWEYNTSVAEEERPLHYWQESKNSIYYSSTVAPLELISGKRHTEKDSNIYTFETNILYKIKNGVIEALFNIDRTKNEKYDSMYEFNRKKEEKNRKNVDKTKNNNKSVKNLVVYKSKQPPVNSKLFISANKIPNDIQNVISPLESKIGKSIFYEKIIRSKEMVNYNKVIFENFRYKQNNELVKDGIYVYSENNGFIYVSNLIHEAKNLINNFSFFDKVNSKNIVLGKVDLTLFYIVNGIMLLTELDYETINYKGSENFTLEEYSHMSVYPITSYYENSFLKNKKEDLLEFNAHLFKNKILRKGKVVQSESVQAIGSTYIYSIRKGICVASFYNHIFNSIKNNKIILSNKKVIDNAYFEDKSFEKNINKLVNKNNKFEEDFQDYESGIDYSNVDEFEDENDDMKVALDDFNTSIKESLDLGIDFVSKYSDNNELATNVFNFCENLEGVYNPLSKWIDNILNSKEIKNDDDEYFDEDEMEFINRNNKFNQ